MFRLYANDVKTTFSLKKKKTLKIAEIRNNTMINLCQHIFFILILLSFIYR